MDAVAQLRLEKARRSLDAARACLGEGLWDDAVNRAGHAALLAARAALGARGEDHDEPGALILALRARPIKGVPADAPDALSDLCEDAEVADRADGEAFDEEEALCAVDMAERLVAALARGIEVSPAGPGGENCS